LGFARHARQENRSLNDDCWNRALGSESPYSGFEDDGAAFPGLEVLNLSSASKFVKDPLLDRISHGISVRKVQLREMLVISSLRIVVLGFRHFQARRNERTRRHYATAVAYKFCSERVEDKPSTTLTALVISFHRPLPYATSGPPRFEACLALALSGDTHSSGAMFLMRRSSLNSTK